MTYGAAFEDPPLHQAIEAGNAAELQALVGAGADVNAPNPAGETPLALAARVGNLSAVETLLRHGANKSLEHRTNAGRTALLYAVEGEKPVHTAIAKLLLKAGAQANVTTGPGGDLPLHVVVMREGSIDSELLSQLLMQFPEAIHVFNHRGETPSVCAARWGHVGIIEAHLPRPKAPLPGAKHSRGAAPPSPVHRSAVEAAAAAPLS